MQQVFDELLSVAAQHINAATEAATAQFILHPFHIAVELFFGVLVIYFMYFVPVRKPRNPSEDPPTEEEARQMIHEFRSEAFDSKPEEHSNVFGDPIQVAGYSGNNVIVKTSDRGLVSALNLASFNYFNFSTHHTIVEAAKATVRAYGVGSCGPRGFYGTMKPHLDLEADLARFLGTESAIIYAMSCATTSTLIPGFAARGDTLFCDDQVQISVQGGCSLSRSQVIKFRHNDVVHLEKLLQEFLEGEKRKKRKLFRRFVVTEGLFRNRGDLCCLPELIKICAKYKSRIILDDSFGFGALGPTGRGTPEHFGIPLNSIDIYIGSLSVALGSVGGFCAGSNMVVDHQRLASTGYVFSASMPPFCAVAASKAVELLENDSQRCRDIQTNAKMFRSFFSDGKNLPQSIALIPCVDDVSPICHFVVKASKTQSLADEKKFHSCAQKLFQRHDIAACRSVYNDEEENFFPPSLRIVVKSQLSKHEVEHAANVIAQCLKEEFE